MQRNDAMQFHNANEMAIRIAMQPTNKENPRWDLDLLCLSFTTDNATMP